MRSGDLTPKPFRGNVDLVRPLSEFGEGDGG
jgi:hypothetical protein